MFEEFYAQELEDSRSNFPDWWLIQDLNIDLIEMAVKQ
jgi:hypothetical protein